LIFACKTTLWTDHLDWKWISLSVARPSYIEIWLFETKNMWS